MKIFNKIMAFLIVASFVFSGEVIARNNRIDDRNRTSSITARKRIPTATTRKSSGAARKKVSTGVTRRPSTPVTKATPVRPQRKIAARKAPIQTSPKARAVRRTRKVAPSRHAAVPARENKRAAAPKAKFKAKPAQSFNIPEVNGRWSAQYELNNGTTVTRTPDGIAYQFSPGKPLTVSHLRISARQSQAELINELVKQGGIKKVTPLQE